jgi:FemAB-related protein (PEP-CTERM system-associated)
VVTVRDASCESPEPWDSYVQRAPQGTLFHLSGWSNAVRRTFGHTPAHLRAERDGKTVGVLPLFHVKSPLFGSMLVSTPNAVYGGVVADDAEANDALIQAAKQKATASGVKYLELRNVDDHAALDPELARKDLYVTFDQPIGPDENEMLKRWPSDIRRMIKLGVKHGFTVETGRHALLEEFYQAYASSVRALGTPVFSRRLFVELLDAFPTASDIMVIRRGGQVAGAVMSFYFRGTVLPYYAGAYAEFYRHGINNFMYWELMRHAARWGCTSFDFGRSKLGTGACAFKRGWRMNERALPYRYFLVRAKELPNLNPTNPRFRVFIRAWKRLPLNVTMKLGPMIVRHLP